MGYEGNSISPRSNMALVRAIRWLIKGLLAVLPVRHRVNIYNWLKARSMRTEIARAGVVVISYPKSGRTWLRILLSRCYASTYGLDRNVLIKNDNFHRLNPEIPPIAWYHGKYIGEIASIRDRTELLKGKKVVFLIRNPIDVSVSCYFHLFGGRSKPEKRAMQGLPSSMADMPINRFVLESKWSVSNITRFMREWAASLEGHPDVLTLRYEDIRSGTAEALTIAGHFLGHVFSAETIDLAVTESSFEKLKEQEQNGTIANAALSPRNAADPNSFKVRRGKVGGYIDYLSPEAIFEVERIVTGELPLSFNYRPSHGGKIGEEPMQVELSPPRLAVADT